MDVIDTRGIRGKEAQSQDFKLAIFLFFATLLLCYAYIVPAVCGVYHDDAIYVVTAKALSQGDGYRLINLPESPSQTKYPILYPLFGRYMVDLAGFPK